jgi:transposase
MMDPKGWQVAVAPIDLRCGMDRLLVLVQSLGSDGFSGAAYVFRNRSGNRIKVLCVDPTGVWLCVRRLHRGSFHWPKVGDAFFELSAAQFAWLCQGVRIPAMPVTYSCSSRSVILVDAGRVGGCLEHRLIC